MASSQIGSLNVVVIDLGTDQGVEPGHLFDIYNGGEQIRDKVRVDRLRAALQDAGFEVRDTKQGTQVVPR